MLELIAQRNRDFLACCREEIRRVSPGKPIRTPEIAALAAARRPKAYYMTYDYALRRLRRHRRNPRPSRSSPQWDELSERVADRQLRQGLTDRQALQRELTEGAPSSFFLSPSYAERLFQRLN